MARTRTAPKLLVIQSDDRASITRWSDARDYDVKVFGNYIGSYRTMMEAEAARDAILVEATKGASR